MLANLENYHKQKYLYDNSINKLNYLVKTLDLDIEIYSEKDRCLARVLYNDKGKQSNEDDYENSYYKRCNKKCNGIFCKAHSREINETIVKNDFYTHRPIKYSIQYEWERHGIFGFEFIAKLKDKVVFQDDIPFWLDYKDKNLMYKNKLIRNGLKETNKNMFNLHLLKFNLKKKIFNNNKINIDINLLNKNNIDMIVNKSTNRINRLLNLFHSYLDNLDYMNYIETNNIKYVEEIIESFLSKYKLTKLININKNKKFFENCKKIVEDFDKIYKIKNDIDDENIESRYKNYIKNKNNNHEAIKELEEWWENIEKVKITDYKTKANIILAKELNESEDELVIYYLKNKNKQIIGEVVEWYDEKLIPDKFKFKNIVQQIDSTKDRYGLPLYKYILYENKTCYHNLPKLSYKKYRYNRETKNMQPTNEIQDL